MEDIYKKYGWGEGYNNALSRGYSHGYARWLADNYCERKATNQSQPISDLE